jgi:hypothetical protein
MKSLMYEHKLISNLHNEFLELTNYFKAYSKSNFYLRYYRVNRQQSPHDNYESSLYRSFNNIVYDVFEYTPVLEISQIEDSYEDDQRTIGTRFTSTSNITVFTIENCNISDMVVFPYSPNKSNEIYRVNNVTTSINSNDSKRLNFYQLTLETSNHKIESLENIKIANHYIYFLPYNKYIYFDRYNDLISAINESKRILSSLSFDENREIYNVSNIDNERIFEFVNKYFLLYQDIQIPFGYKNSYSNTRRSSILEELYKNFKTIKDILDER